VFKDVEVSAIPNDPNVIKNLAYEAGCSFAGTQPYNLNYTLVGNTAKPFLGDLDMAISEKELRNYLSLDKTDSDEKMWAALEKRLKECCSHLWSLNKGLRQLHLLLPLMTKDNGYIEGYNLDGTRTGIPGMVQVDILIGNVTWMSKIVSGAPKSSKWKALYRTNLLREIVSNITWQEKTSNLAIQHRLVLDYKRGVRQITYAMVAPTGKQRVKQEVRLKERYVTKSAEGLALMLFGPTVRWADINSFEKLYAKCLTKDFRYKPLLQKSCESLAEELKRQGREVPPHLTYSYLLTAPTNPSDTSLPSHSPLP